MMKSFDSLWICYMKKKILNQLGLLAFLVIGTACSQKHEASTQSVVHYQVDPKLKQKAVTLQKKLGRAERTLSEDQQSIDRLRHQLCEAELNFIESKLENLEKKWKVDPQRLIQSARAHVSNLFIEEREVLIRIIQRGPETSRAQVLLDRILQLITEMSNSIEKA